MDAQAFMKLIDTDCSKNCVEDMQRMISSARKRPLPCSAGNNVWLINCAAADVALRREGSGLDIAKATRQFNITKKHVLAAIRAMETRFVAENAPVVANNEAASSQPTTKRSPGARSKVASVESVLGLNIRREQCSLSLSDDAIAATHQMLLEQAQVKFAPSRVVEEFQLPHLLGRAADQSLDRYRHKANWTWEKYQFMTESGKMSYSIGALAAVSRVSGCRVPMRKLMGRFRLDKTAVKKAEKMVLGAMTEEDQDHVREVGKRIKASKRNSHALPSAAPHLSDKVCDTSSGSLSAVDLSFDSTTSNIVIDEDSCEFWGSGASVDDAMLPVSGAACGTQKKDNVAEFTSWRKSVMDE
eukprot:Clim_evm137s147 gene=Clim_evmTU137s147